MPLKYTLSLFEPLKFKILWDDGTFDIGNNGQIIYYDIYFDFNPGLDDPYVSFISPNQNDELTGDIQIELDGDAIKI